MHRGPRGAATQAVLLAVALGASALPAHADEGQWTPEQLDELGTQFTALGIRLAPKQIWSAEGGLGHAVLNMSGCSAAFISPDGLIATNHHCAYRAIQSQSSSERDLLQLGFVAKKREQELEAKGETIRVLERISDVTDTINKAAAAAKDDGARYDAIEQAKKKLVADCEKKSPATRCEVESFFLGATYRLYETTELRDLRLVYAPPRSIGEYGGEIDNWMWPRHSGDFTLLRAYVAKDGTPAEYAASNVPYRSTDHFKISGQGVMPGDAVMVMGYPRQTMRHLPAPEMQRQVEQVLPGIVDLYGEWLKLLDAQSARSKDVAIKVAALKKGLANRHKNARGMLEGIRVMGLGARRNKERDKLQTLAKTKAQYAKPLEELASLADEARRSAPRELLLHSAQRGTNLLSLAVDLARLAEQRAKPDLERLPGYQERDLPDLWQSLLRRMRNFDAGVEAEIIASLVVRAHALPGEQKPTSLQALGAATAKRDAVAKGLLGRLKTSQLSKEARVKQLFEAEPGQLAKFADPVLDWGRKVAADLDAAERDEHRREGALSRLGPTYFAALREIRPGPLYPDANGTLRISLAKVQGYAPKDGLVATPQTTLSGAIAKHTGTFPFELPAAVLEKAPAAKNSFWADPALGDLPLCFLSNADTTGGNSGSPVLNARGELVALNFDRVWENIAGDYGYSNERSRNISVDIRYLLWLLDRVEDAGALLREMGVAQYREAGARRSRVESAHRPKTAPSPPKPKSSSGCALSEARPPSSTTTLGGMSWPWLMAAFLAAKRRRLRKTLKT